MGEALSLVVRGFQETTRGMDAPNRLLAIIIEKAVGIEAGQGPDWSAKSRGANVGPVAICRRKWDYTHAASLPSNDGTTCRYHSISASVHD
jgi:hypothetical protein